MKSSQLSSLDQAQKTIGEALFAKGLSIRESRRDAIMITLGKLTFASMQSKKERESDPLYRFSIERTIEQITEYVEGIESLENAWDRARPIFIQTLLS